MKTPAVIEHLPPSPTAIEAAFKKYAAAYDELDKLQHNSMLLPGGDQKTGVVGEYYAALFAVGTYPSGRIEIAPNSQKAWDIKVNQPGRETKIQVKTISGFSKTGKISTIKENGWDVLYIIHLNREFSLDGFWIVTPTDISASGDLKEIYGPRPGKARKSGKINFGFQRLDELLNGIEKGKERLANSKEECVVRLLEIKSTSKK